MKHTSTFSLSCSHRVPPIEPLRLGHCDEELAAVGVGPGVGHGQEAGAGVLQVKVLVAEGAAVDGLAAGAVVVGEVATLKVRDLGLWLS